ncbi:hypothetical protein BU26DRAFT_565177 [Trematosphaeria pertusa]|uniref:Uncharacterized protein n=1 Tax=Trematosphaeria pertusa TaxID=390896 RepID=A0A6A6IJ07_9PLEO|nr:uncharacterized protein BU26DRAFT_565177 [Trematosphaeria pertusa]KAF2249533.1 hypothetical protein BU26DRAFT_565177 [Trematosphaeria pertusa]
MPADSFPRSYIRRALDDASAALHAGMLDQIAINYSLGVFSPGDASAALPGPHVRSFANPPKRQSGVPSEVPDGAAFENRHVRAADCPEQLATSSSAAAAAGTALSAEERLLASVAGKRSDNTAVIGDMQGVFLVDLYGTSADEPRSRVSPSQQ